MAGKIATRNAYGETLVELAEKYPELVVLDADLSGSTMTKFFAAAYPQRFLTAALPNATWQASPPVWLPTGSSPL